MPNYYKELYEELSIMPVLHNQKIAFNPKLFNIKKDFSFTEVATLNAILRFGPIKISELAKLVLLPLKTVSMMINSFVKKAYVNRFQKAGDRRSYYVEFTKEFKQIYLAKRQIAVEKMQLYLGNSLTDEECECFAEALKKVADVLWTF